MNTKAKDRTRHDTRRAVRDYRHKEEVDETSRLSICLVEEWGELSPTASEARCIQIGQDPRGSPTAREGRKRRVNGTASNSTVLDND